MKFISRKSWHYRFIDKCGFYPKNAETTYDYNCKLVFSIYWCFIAFGWVKLLYDRRKKRNDNNSIEFID